MPDPSDFSQIAQMGQDERGDGGAPGLAQLQESLSRMRDTQSRLVVQNQQNEQVLPPQSIQVNTAKGTVTMKDLPIATYEAYNRDRQQLNEIRGAFSQEADRLKQREEQARNQPAWVQLATALSANLASQKDMPGWVRGLGQTAAQLNPTADQIRNERLGVMGEEAKLAEKGQALGMEQERRALEAKREGRLTEENRIKDLLNVEANASIEARKTGNFDKDLFLKQRLAMGDSPQTAQAAADRLEGVAKDQKLAMAQAEKDAETKAASKEQQKINEEIRMQDFWWKKYGAEEAAKDHREFIKEAVATKKDEAKKQNLGPVLEAKVEDILVAKRSTNRLLEIFDPNTQNPEYKHFQAIVGPLRGRETDMEKWLGTLNSTDAQLVAKINLQFANAVKTLGAGSYGYRISERGFLQSFTEALKNGAPQNYGNLKAWSTFYNDKIESFKDLKDGYDWSRVDAIMQTPPGQPMPDRKKSGEKKGADADPLGVR